MKMVMKASDGREFPAEQADLAERYEALKERGARLVGLEDAPRPIGLLLMDPFTGVATTELGERCLWAQELVKWWTDVLEWRMDWDAAVAREAGDKLVAFPQQGKVGHGNGDKGMWIKAVEAELAANLGVDRPVVRVLPDPEPIGSDRPERLGDVEACERLGEEARLRQSLRQYVREISDRDGWAAHAAGRGLDLKS